jgi:hypothetical protein
VAGSVVAVVGVVVFVDVVQRACSARGGEAPVARTWPATVEGSTAFGLALTANELIETKRWRHAIPLAPKTPAWRGT